MFFQRDYILRMIEMMGDLMRRIYELMSDLARVRLLSDACRRHGGISLETAQQLTPDSLKELLQPTPRMMVSEILYIQATCLSMPQEEREALLYKSLVLLASLWAEGPLCQLRADRLLELKGEVGYLMRPEELWDCARFLAEGERYADMEDALFQAVEALPPGLEALPPGLEAQAYAREGAALLKEAAKGNPELLAGAHTTREELVQAAEELLALGGQ